MPASASSTVLDVGLVRRCPGQAPDRVRGDEVLRRQRVLGREPGHHRPAADEPGRRDRVALGPPVRRRRPVGRGWLRQLLVGEVAGLGRARPARSVRAGAPTGRRSPAGRGASRSVVGSTSAAATMAASGSTRPGALSRRAAIRSRAYHSDRTRASDRGAADLVDAGRAPPRDRVAGPPAGPADATSAANSSWAQLELALLGQLVLEQVAQRRSAARRRARRSSARTAGSGRVDQSAAEWCFSSAKPSSCSVRAARPTRSKFASRAASSVSKIRRGTQPDLDQAGQVLARRVQHPLAYRRSRRRSS